jgi:hypothetical protein
MGKLSDVVNTMIRCRVNILCLGDEMEGAKHKGGGRYWL